MSGESLRHGGRYQWFGWTVSASADGDLGLKRLTETHEYFHRQLDDTTAFGGLMTTIAALAEAKPNERWLNARDGVQMQSDLLHETFAVGMSLLTTQRQLVPVDGYPMYDRYVAIADRLVGAETHPWVALGALRAAATACMQSPALGRAARLGLEHFDPADLKRDERPNHRLVALLNSNFTSVVASAHEDAQRLHGAKAWWRGGDGVRFTPESMDGHAGELSQKLHRDLLADAAAALRATGATVLDGQEHHGDLVLLLEQARALVPDSLVRIGALVETPDAELLHGGALDSQTITLGAAPDRATVLPYGSASGLSGTGAQRHGFVTLVRPERLKQFYELQGIELPDATAVACLRTTVFDGERRDSVLLIVVEEPTVLRNESAPMYVSITSSAAAVAPDMAARWMQAAEADRLSLVLDTPATAALRRWCANETTRFRTATQRVTIEGMDVRIIAGRVEDGERRSPLIVIPTTEFGARWFEAATAEDAVMGRAVMVDPEIFEEESAHLDIVLSHVLLEEPVVGTGSWRQ